MARRNALIQALSQQKLQGDDIIDIRDNVRAQRAEMAFDLLSKFGAIFGNPLARN